jgi:GNAT superfamily N-acetyltransferase
MSAIRLCGPDEVETACAIINESAEAYRGIIPADRWHEPYMPLAELRAEIAKGVQFYARTSADGSLAGVMGIQDVKDVTLIRHAYVRTRFRGQGIGSDLLAHLRNLTKRPILIGTWRAATWAVGFYQKHGFRLLPEAEKNRLLKTYWTIPERQVETSVVLADDRWRSEA